MSGGSYVAGFWKMGSEVKTRKILFVDDDAQALASFRRQFRAEYEVHIALDAAKALEVMAADGPFTVVVSDLKMPGMDGIEFLAKAKESAPETVRVLLTGYADMDNAMEAVNAGGIFRFLTKPCPSQMLSKALGDAIEQYDLVYARKELYSLKRFKNAMEGVIAGFSTLLEARDPYTAGHQRRVAELSCRIAEQMGFASDHVDALRIAGLLHDIGKVYVPADFLNRPGRLRDQEFSIIQLHAEIGADILAPVEFDWPISTIIRQHHERLDGTGYPQGLEGDAILLESRIIAVVDVIDAMSSHRPYRASLGLEKALEEIGANEGKAYDAEVSRICLALFADNDFYREFSAKMEHPFIYP